MENNTNKAHLRYSDEELQEFKELILEKIEIAKKDLAMLNAALAGDSNSADDTAPSFKPFEDGSNVLAKEETAQLAYRQHKIIQSLENALVRIENKTYGIDRITGELIPKERLRLVPHATLSVQSKEMENSQRNKKRR